MLKDIWLVIKGKLSWAMIISDAEMLGRAEYRARIAEERNATMALALREMDQIVHQMSNCPDWESMRKQFVLLQGPVEERMRTESKRIETLLVHEIKKVYDVRAHR